MRTLMSSSFWYLIRRPLSWLEDPEDQVETQLAYEPQPKDWIEMHFRVMCECLNLAGIISTLT